MKVKDRILKGVNTTDPNECWSWQGYKTDAGYGQFWYNNKPRRTHLAAYEEFIGPIIPGLVVHQSCGHRACCNPAHLSLMTRRESIRSREAT